MGNVKNIWNTYFTQTLYFFLQMYKLKGNKVHIGWMDKEFMRSSWLAWNKRLGSKLCQVWKKNPDWLSPPWSPWKEARPWGSHSRSNASPAHKSLGPFCDAAAPRTWGYWWRRGGWRSSGAPASGAPRAQGPSDAETWGAAPATPEKRRRAPGSGPGSPSCPTGTFCALRRRSLSAGTRCRCSSPNCCWRSRRLPICDQCPSWTSSCHTWSASASSGSSRSQTCSRSLGGESKRSLSRVYPATWVLWRNSRWTTKSGEWSSASAAGSVGKKGRGPLSTGRSRPVSASYWEPAGWP